VEYRGVPNASAGSDPVVAKVNIRGKFNHWLP
jgi:hypothetical protein